MCEGNLSLDVLIAVTGLKYLRAPAAEILSKRIFLKMVRLVAMSTRVDLCELCLRLGLLILRRLLQQHLNLLLELEL